MDIWLTIFHYEFYISIGYEFLFMFFGLLIIYQCFKAVARIDHNRR